MSSSRSARKQKVNSTTQAVDFLNSLMYNPKSSNNVTNEAKNKTRVRHLPSSRVNLFENKVQLKPSAPPSDPIWDIPSPSPEAGQFVPRRRIPQSEPPRRSGRTRKADVENTPSRKSRRLASASVGDENHDEDHDEEQNEAPITSSPLVVENSPSQFELRGVSVKNGIGNEEQFNEKQHEGVKANTEEEHEAGNVMDEYVDESDQVRLFSDSEEEPVAASSDHIGLPSSSVFFSQRPSLPVGEPDNDIFSDMKPSHEARNDSEQGSQSLTVPEQASDQAGSERTSTNPSATSVVGNHTSAGKVDENEDAERARRKESVAVVVHSSANVEKPANDQPQESDSAHDLPEESDPSNDLPQKPDSASYHPSEDESSPEDSSPAREEYRHSPDAEREDSQIRTPLNKRRRTETNEMQHTRGAPLTSVSLNQLTPRDEQSNRNTDVHRENSVTDENPSQVTSNGPENVEDNAGKESWFDEAMNFGQQKHNWAVLIQEKRTLEQMADPAMAKYFKDIKSLTSVLRTKYTEITGRLDVNIEPLQGSVRECDNLLTGISNEGSKILDHVYYLATWRDESSQRLSRARDLVVEFEARVYPQMIKLILVCFKAYYTGRILFPAAYDHFLRTMRMLLRFSDRIFSLTREKYVQCPVHSPIIHAPLKGLIEALESKLLIKRAPEFSDPMPRLPRWRRRRREMTLESDDEEAFEDFNFPARTGKEWSDAEGYALLDGLRMYQDGDRYIQILGHFGQRLPGRTIQELRAKAREIHDSYRPEIQVQLQTEEGRRQWQWLLSVR